MASTPGLLKCGRRDSVGRSAELLCVGILFLCLPVSSQVEGGNITFSKNGDNNLYGNNVTFRTAAVPTSAQNSWVDNETQLPAGVLVRFYIYIHRLSSTTIDAQSNLLRLQIWRKRDPNINSFLLVWQQRVQVNLTSTGGLYSLRLNTAIAIEAGDKIGFTNEGNYGPISFEYSESHRTYLSRVNLTNGTGIPNYPLTGDIVKFDPVYFPAIFSIAVEVDPRGNITFAKNGDNNLFGNNVTLRSSDLQDSSRKSWVDNETPLPAGVLIRFYIYIHSLNPTIDAQSYRVRLQIWRERDVSLPSYLLVWQQRVLINFTSTGALYSFRMKAPVTVEAGDKIGFTNEGDYGPISFNYVERHRTYFSKENVTNATGVPNYPLTGDVVQFDYTYLPAIFSIAVEVDPKASTLTTSSATTSHSAKSEPKTSSATTSAKSEPKTSTATTPYEITALETVSQGATTVPTSTGNNDVTIATVAITVGVFFGIVLGP